MAQILFNYYRLRNTIGTTFTRTKRNKDTIMEVFKILHNKSSEQINDKYRHLDRHSLRKNTNNFLRVPELHEHRKCTGFTYCGAKIFNSLSIKIRETQDSTIFKELVKNWIWEEIPSY